ncbi:Histone-lysine N-methyltransferase SETMAR, partial [Habropoda laboriosa]
WSTSHLIHDSSLRPSATVTPWSCSKEWNIVQQKLKVQQPTLVKRNGPILLHDNARPEVASTTVQKLY